MGMRALLVGCNYPGTKVQLHGCVNDVKRMHRTLTSRYGFDESDILVLVDTDESGMQPTGANIRSCLAKLVRGTEPGDTLVFHYSGHGTQVPPEASEAADDTGAEEAIVPTDMNLLTDDDFRELVNEIPAGAVFTFLSDSCHSGGLIDAEKEQIGDSVGGGGGLMGMVSQAFQGSSGARDFDASEAYGGEGRRRYGGDPSYAREGEEYGEDDEGYERQGRRRSGYDDEESYGGRREAEYKGYGGRREGEYEGYGGRREEGYGGRPEAEYEGYGGRQEAEYESGYDGRREAEYESGYDGRREAEYEGGYGGRRGGEEDAEFEGYGRRRGEEEYASGYGGRRGGQEGAYAEQLGGGSYGGGYGGRRSPIVSKEIPVDMLTQILSERTGHQVDIGNIRTTLFDMFGDSASPSVKKFANLVLQQLQGGGQGGIMGAVSSLATEFLQSKLDGQDEEQASSYLAPAQSAGNYRPRPQRGGGRGADCGILLSGCQSNETSADANPSGNAADSYGAFSNAIQTVLSQTEGTISNRDLILQVRKVLQTQGFKQHPCLYCSDDHADFPFIRDM